MKLIKPSFEILEQGFSLDDIYKHIELCGRTCYKSNDKITKDSAKPFVNGMINSKHFAMLEHGTIYLKFFCNKNVCEQCNRTIPNKLLKNFKIIQNRREAIAYAVNLMQDGDLLAICGKGAEDYLEIKGQKLPYSDKEELLKLGFLQN